LGETKEKITVTLFRLLDLKPYREITIKDICDGTHISRNAFYYHFYSKDALIKWIIDQQFLKYSFPYFKIKTENIATKSFFNYILDRKTFYDRIYQIDGGRFLSDCLSHAYSIVLKKEYIKEYANVKKKDKERIDPRVCIRYANAGTAAVVVFWIGDGMRISVDCIARDLYLMLTKSLEDVVDQYLY
jgi:AcrR family transcriptional regulator